MPYLDDVAHIDHYSRTKMLAEKAVLAAHAPPGLTTVAIRPAAIYGEGETRHLPRVTQIFNAGLDFMAIGHPGVLCDWVHVDNLVHALLLAGDVLARAPASVGGKPFFISDGEPINNFVFMQRVFGTKEICWLYVPTPLMYACGLLCETLHRLSSPWWPIRPFLTRAEVCKVGCTHHMVLTNAFQLLGYKPLLSADEGLRRTRAWFAPQLVSRRTRRLRILYKALGIIAAMVTVLMVCYLLLSWCSSCN